MVTARKRAVPKKTSGSRTAHLEEKLDDLVSILKASQPGTSTIPAIAGAPSQPDSASVTPYHYSPPVNVTPQQHVVPMPSRLDSLATVATTSSTSNGHHPDGSPYVPGAPPPILPPVYYGSNVPPVPAAPEAEVYYQRFKSWLKNFPFMTFPHDLNAEDLRHKNPFLWLCIMNVTTMSVAQQQITRDTVREQLAKKAILDNERGMDLLLGIIAHLAW